MAVGSGFRVLVTCAMLAGCAAASPDPAHSHPSVGWVETKLFFGLGPADDRAGEGSEAKWRDFLDREVTPRFPAGLSVINVYGQWQGPGQAVPGRLRSKLLVIDHPEDAVDEAAIEAIRIAWKRSTGAQSVMRVTEAVDVSF